MNKLRYIKDYLIEKRHKYLLGILSLLMVDVLQLVLPKILGNITDLLKEGLLTKNILAKYMFIIILIALGVAVFRFFYRYYVYGTSKYIETELRNRYYNHLQKLSANYYNSHKTGDLMAHATNDINNIRAMLGPGITMALDSTVIPVVAFTMMAATGGLKLTFIVFIPLMMLGGIIIFFVRIMHKTVENMQEAFSNLTETARENFSGIRVVKSYVQEIKEVLEFEKANAHNKQMNLKYVRLMSLLFPSIMSVSSLSFAIALWYGGLLVIEHQISLGDFVAFNSYLGMLIWPIAALGWITSMFQRGLVSLQRINIILDEKPEIEDRLDTPQVSSITGDMRFNGLTFTYPGSAGPVLKNIDISIGKGKTLGIVGSTGSGKTTLLNLILRLYNVDRGMLYIDGIDINDLPLSLLRKNIGYIPQDTFLFSTSIMQNIEFFHGCEEQDIIKASKISKLYDDVMEFPSSFNTIVGERGITLSGGQKQRVAIARAVLKNPSILILDDCLSAVDTGTEKEILWELKKIMDKRTSIIVSHRVSTVKDADEIIVLEEGEIVERGSHDDLLEKSGLYYDLYQKQQLAEQLDKE